MSRLSTGLRSLALKLGATSLVAGLLAGCDGATITITPNSSSSDTSITSSTGIVHSSSSEAYSSEYIDSSSSSFDVIYPSSSSEPELSSSSEAEYSSQSYSSSSDAMRRTPAIVFQQNCAACHGEDTQSGIVPIDSTRYSLESLTLYIEDNMSLLSPEHCVGECAELSALYILDIAGATARGEVIFEQQCSLCHGEDGEGGFIPLDISEVSSWDAIQLSGFIHDEMPYGNSEACTDNCADDVTVYIKSRTVNGDIQRGAALYAEQQCSACHGDEGQGPIATINSEYWLQAELADYIADNMPFSQPWLCVGSCAQDIAAFIKTWPTDTVSSSSSSSSQSSINYGLAEYGQLLFESSEQACTLCHGQNAEGVIGPNLLLHNRDTDAVIGFIVAQMPATDPALCDYECAVAITEYLKVLTEQNASSSSSSSSTTQSSSEIVVSSSSSVNPIQELIDEGQHLYEDGQYNCAFCHGTEGSGGAISGVDATQYSPAELAELIIDFHGDGGAYPFAPDCDSLCSEAMAYYLIDAQGTPTSSSSEASSSSDQAASSLAEITTGIRFEVPSVYHASDVVVNETTGVFYFITEGFSGIYSFDIKNSELHGVPALPGYELALSPDGSTLFAAHNDAPVISIYRTSDLGIKGNLQANGSIHDMVAIDNESVVVSYNDSLTIEALTPEQDPLVEKGLAGALASNLTYHSGNGYLYAAAQDSPYVYQRFFVSGGHVGDSSEVSYWDDVGATNKVVLDSQGQILYTSGGDTFYEPDFDRVGALRYPSGSVTFEHLTFNPVNQLLVGITPQGQVIAYSDAGRPLAEMPNAPTNILKLVYTNLGIFAVRHGDNGQAEIVRIHLQAFDTGTISSAISTSSVESSSSYSEVSSSSEGFPSGSSSTSEAVPSSSEEYSSSSIPDYSSESTSVSEVSSSSIIPSSVSSSSEASTSSAEPASSSSEAVSSSSLPATVASAIKLDWFFEPKKILADAERNRTYILPEDGFGIHFIDLTTGDVIYSDARRLDSVDIALSPDNKSLYVAYSTPSTDLGYSEGFSWIEEIELDTLNRLDTIEVNYAIYSIAALDDGTIAVSASTIDEWGYSSIELIDTGSHQVTYSTSMPPAKLAYKNGILAALQSTGYYTPSLHTYQAGNGTLFELRPIEIYPIPENSNIWFSANGQHVITQEGGVYSSYNLGQANRLAPTYAEIADVAFDPVSGKAVFLETLDSTQPAGEAKAANHLIFESYMPLGFTADHVFAGQQVVHAYISNRETDEKWLYNLYEQLEQRQSSSSEQSSSSSSVPSSPFPVKPTVIRAEESWGPTYYLGMGNFDTAEHWEDLTISFDFATISEEFFHPMTIEPLCGADACPTSDGYKFDPYLHEGIIHIDLRLATHFAVDPTEITGLRIRTSDPVPLDFEIINAQWRDDLDSSCASTSGGNIFVGDISSGGIELYSSSSAPILIDPSYGNIVEGNILPLPCDSETENCVKIYGAIGTEARRESEPQQNNFLQSTTNICVGGDVSEGAELDACRAEPAPVLTLCSKEITENCVPAWQTNSSVEVRRTSDEHVVHYTSVDQAYGGSSSSQPNVIDPVLPIIEPPNEWDTLSQICAYY